MLTKFTNWVKHRKYKKLYWRYYDSAKGDDFAKTCFALLMMELENELIRTVALKHPLGQRKTFSMAYECFVMWLIKFNIERSQPREFVVQLVGTLRDNICNYRHYERATFGEIWQAVQDAMPNSLTPGTQTGVPAPWVHIVVSCNKRKIEIHPIPDLNFAIHVMATFKSVQEFTQMLLNASTRQASE